MAVGQGMADDLSVAVVIDELNPSLGIVGLARDVTEGQSKSVLGGRVEFDLSRNVLQLGCMEELVVLAQQVGGVEEHEIMSASARCRLNQDACWIVRVDAHSPEGPFDQGASIREGWSWCLSSQVTSDLVQLDGVQVIGHLLPLWVLLGQDLLRGTIGVHVQTDEEAGLKTPGSEPDWVSIRNSVCQEVTDDFGIAQNSSVGGPGRWALTSTGDDSVGDFEGEQFSEIRHSGQGRFATRLSVQEFQFGVE